MKKAMFFSRFVSYEQWPPPGNTPSGLLLNVLVMETKAGSPTHQEAGAGTGPGGGRGRKRLRNTYRGDFDTSLGFMAEGRNGSGRAEKRACEMGVEGCELGVGGQEIGRKRWKHRRLMNERIGKGTVGMVWMDKT